MQIDLINMSLAFLEGFALIISPCILPILPLVMTGSLGGHKRRPIGIIIGFIITFTLVTLFSRALIELLHLNPNILRTISLIMLVLIGIIMLSNYLTEKLSSVTQQLANVG